MTRWLLVLLLIPAKLFAGDTYFVRKGGSDAADGLSWANAWLTAAKVQSTVVAGDTTIWGRGIWEEVRVKPPAGGSNTNWTVYACSTWYTGTTAAEKLAGAGLTTWSGGKAVTGWYDTTSGANTIKKSFYNPSVYCKTDDDAARLGVAATLRRQGHDSMYVPVAQGSAGVVFTAGGGHGYSGGDNEANMILVKDYSGWTALTADDTVWCACDAPLAFDNNNTTHVRVWGINLKEGHGGALVYREDHIESTFVEHAVIRYGGTDVAGQNPAAVYSEGDAETERWHNHVIACNLGWGCGVPVGSVATAPADGISGHGAVVNIYSQNHMVFDSCVIDKGFAAHGFYFKLTKDGTDPWEGNTVKNCYIDGTNLQGGNVTDPCGIFFFQGSGKDSAYGNVIENTFFGIMEWWESGGADVKSYGGFFCNNSFYNVSRAAIAFKDNGGSVTPPSGTTAFQIRYNVSQKAGSFDDGAVSFLSFTGDDPKDSVFADSNIWYMSSGTLGFRCTNANDNTLTQWRAGNCSGVLRDVISVTTDPGFNDAPNGDFSRPSASGEMNLTYGGQDWTIWGAIQDADANICPTVTLSTPTNNDSIDDYTPTLDLDVTDTDGDIDSVWLYFEDGDPTPDNLLVDTVLTADDDLLVTTSTLTENHDYYWQSIACDTAGCCDTSAIFKFTVDSIPPVVASSNVLLRGTRLNGVKLNANP